MCGGDTIREGGEGILNQVSQPGETIQLMFHDTLRYTVS